MKLLKFFGPLKKPRLFIIRRIVGDSMEPALSHGQLVIGRPTRNFALGDVVIVRHDNLEKIKRIGQFTDGTVYVLGDNVPGSTDSRHFGWLPASTVIAKVIWPRLNSTY